MKYLYFFGLSILLYSCGGFSDYIDDLGDGYYILSESDKERFIYYSASLSQYTTAEDIVIYSTVLDYRYDDQFILVSQQPSLKEHIRYIADSLTYTARAFYFADSLSEHKIPLSYRKKVQQNISDSIFYQRINRFISHSNSIEDQKYFSEISDSILRSNDTDSIYYSGEIKYWIIDKKRSKKMGPFDLSNYERKKIELDIPKTLSLGSE